jgi:hypothetical protein
MEELCLKLLSFGDVYRNRIVKGDLPIGADEGRLSL